MREVLYLVKYQNHVSLPCFCCSQHEVQLCTCTPARSLTCRPFSSFSVWISLLRTLVRLQLSLRVDCLSELCPVLRSERVKEQHQWLTDEKGQRRVPCYHNDKYIIQMKTKLRYKTRTCTISLFKTYRELWVCHWVRCYQSFPAALCSCFSEAPPAWICLPAGRYCSTSDLWEVRCISMDHQSAAHWRQQLKLKSARCHPTEPVQKVLL